ncbi:MAG: exodeoxyribonuclease VII small subunit [Bacilli bacterium]|jgi:exodeoxyribonuclease VII small subunit|nr:exodeoxyribonuclease VII small subunit [Bacilli bacterium]MDD3388836.1 exodeoxyribonuclease VII small subunit [Bacilli bacterium]MDD4345013.1 exodeoxyribonuclease VII small subunit [Bacilli bacterium]MDD4520516.1 exodeoxyribonuclease VII small subunit [Bacilli bacterium]MDY0399204.1 exodeoxyribonuclease VII small subunit [Bacilli bacterium]
MNDKKVSFEERLKRLEVIVQKMESGELALEDALKLFEEGNTLLKSLQEELQKAEAEVIRVSGENKSE